MDCIKIRKLISSYIDKELPAKEFENFESHIKNCNKCMEEVNQLKLIINNVNSLDEVELPRYFHREMMTRLKNEFAPIDIAKVKKKNRRRRSKLNRNYIISFISSAAVISMLFFVGEMATSHKSPTNINSNNYELPPTINRSQSLLPDKTINYNIKLEVSNLENAINEINSLSGENIAQDIATTFKKNGEVKVANITKKIPLENYEEIKHQLKNIGALKEESENTVKIDNEILKIQLSQEEKEKELNSLTSLINKVSPENLLKLNERISQVEFEILLNNLQLENSYRDLAEPSIEITLTENTKDMSVLFFSLTAILVGVVIFAFILRFLKKREL